MHDSFKSSGSRTKSGGGPPSSPLISLGDAAPIVRRGGLATALTPTRPRNRRERLARGKRLRELMGGKDRKV